MKETTVSLIFDRRGKATDTTPAAVEVVVRQGRGAKRVKSTGVLLTEKQWRSGRVVNHPEANRLNAKIAAIVAETTALVNSEGFDINTLWRAERSSPDFLGWMQSEISIREVRPNTRKSHLSALGILRQWGGIKTFRDLTLPKIAAFDDWLKTRYDKQNTIWGRHKVLRLYINRAVVKGIITDNPYKRFRVPKGSTDTIRYLTDEQRTAIERLELHGMAATARDMFLLACYTGLAYSDMIKISPGDVQHEGGRTMIIDRRIKTGTQYRLTLLPPAIRILDRYEWNMNRLSNQKLNAYLKGIGAVVGEPRLTMHMGRHTFATWALSQGVPIEVVSKMLAHKDIATTQIYAKILQREVDAGFDLLSTVIK